MLKSEIRRDEYRAQAERARALAAASVLLEVRRKHETAAAVWQGLADAEDRSSTRSIDAIARAPHRRRSPRPIPAEDVPCKA